MKINNFRGDLTDISAKKEALSLTCVHSGKQEAHAATVPFICVVSFIFITFKRRRALANYVDLCMIAQVTKSGAVQHSMHTSTCLSRLPTYVCVVCYSEAERRICSLLKIPENCSMC